MTIVGTEGILFVLTLEMTIVLFILKIPSSKLAALEYKLITINQNLKTLLIFFLGIGEIVGDFKNIP